MNKETAFFNDEGLCYLVCEEEGNPGAVVHLFNNYPTPGGSLALSESDATRCVDDLREGGSVTPFVWDAQGSRFIRVPKDRHIGLASRMIATNALRWSRYQEHDKWGSFDENSYRVEFFAEDDAMVTFKEFDGTSGNPYKFSDEEITHLSSETGLPFEVIVAYAEAFETADITDPEDIEYRFQGILDGRSLYEWYLDEGSVLEDIVVDGELVSIEGLVDALGHAGFGLVVTDETSVDLDYKTCNGYVFRRHI
jgi:hypothetical protein